MRTCITLGATLALASCSTLQNIHDPQFGLLSRENIPALVKSIRCELTTFYAANAARKKKLDDLRNSLRQHKTPTIQIKDVLNHRYFDLDTEVYGAFVLEAKVVDTIGAPGTSTALTNLLHSNPPLNPTPSQSLTISPNIGSQGTYDMNYNFAIQQNDTLSTFTRAITEYELEQISDNFGGADDLALCYRGVVPGRYDALAQGKYFNLARFHRLTVNGGLPLAAWLQENTTIMGVSRNILADVNPPKNDSGGT